MEAPSAQEEGGGEHSFVFCVRCKEKERIRKELEEAGEDVGPHSCLSFILEVPEEEEVVEEELPQMPEDEEEQQALFDKTAGDRLQTVAPFVTLKPLEPRPAALLRRNFM